MTDQPANVLGADARPRFFPVGGAAGLGLERPPPRRGIAVRVWSRSLAGMQKEVLVASSPGDRAWRLASDEGPYLDGHDEAPFPLAHMTTGMVASYAHELLALASRRGARLEDLRLTLHSYYTMEGSALRGTMVGAALPPELEVEADSDLGADELHAMVADAVRASPVAGLLGDVLRSVFTLSVDGARVTPARVDELATVAPSDPGDLFTRLAVDGRAVQPLVARVAPPGGGDGEGGAGSSYAESQSRTLHVSGVCTPRADGAKDIVLRLHSPRGSTFRLRSDEAAQAGGSGLAPEATSYLAAGIAFCFMTQFGRFATITGTQLDRYRLVQDLHVDPGGVSGGTGRGVADPVETHVYLDTPEGADYARRILDMSEQTCFLHALCRTELETRVRVRSAG